MAEIWSPYSFGSPGVKIVLWGVNFFIYLFIFYLFGVLRRFQHCTGHITTGSWKGRGNQYIQLVKVLYCNGKQLPAFPLEVEPWTEPRPQRWEVRVSPLCHRGPSVGSQKHRSFWLLLVFNLKGRFFQIYLIFGTWIGGYNFLYFSSLDLDLLYSQYIFPIFLKLYIFLHSYIFLNTSYIVYVFPSGGNSTCTWNQLFI